MRAEVVETALRRLQDAGVTPLMMPAPLIGQETEIEIGGKKIPYFAAFGRNALVGSCASCRV